MGSWMVCMVWSMIKEWSNFTNPLFDTLIWIPNRGTQEILQDFKTRRLNGYQNRHWLQYTARHMHYCHQPNLTFWNLYIYKSQSRVTNSPAYRARPLTCGVPSECLGTRSYETTSRDQRGKIRTFSRSMDACTVANPPIVKCNSQSKAQLYSASIIYCVWQ